MNYPINTGKRNNYIRVGCEEGLYQFIHDYAEEMGMSISSSARRLMLIGARCEADHGKAIMPASYRNLRAPSEVEMDLEFEAMLEDEV